MTTVDRFVNTTTYLFCPLDNLSCLENFSIRFKTELFVWLRASRCPLNLNTDVKRTELLIFLFIFVYRTAYLYSMSMIRCLNSTV